MSDAATVGKWLAIASALVPVGVWALSRPSQEEVHVIAAEQSGRAAAVVNAALSAHAVADVAERAAEREEAEVMFEMALAGLAADLESDRRRKFESAAGARKEFRDALARGMAPAKAAVYVRDWLQTRK